ncbi:hypothetical protein MTR67_024200 [Solanum verrucosum]|uniref:Uncharacterized protein n=1 Tax=Solanum verrucosum TaxID=315347 RepID=A0AAF0QXZ7_SOLVR|nr:hypothetical protein MTR67_024200 [Solanum verrucosum]
MTKEVTTLYGVSLWKSIRSLWDDFKPNTKIKVVDGAKTRFWKEDWHEAGNLESLFPDIHTLVLQQQSTIAELWTPHGWNIIFRRHLNDWEIPRVTEFFSVIEQFSGLEPRKDRLQWLGNCKGTFRVSATYRKLNHTITQHPNGPGNTVGRPRSHTKWPVLCGYWLRKNRQSLVHPDPVQGHWPIAETIPKAQKHLMGHAW